APSGSEGTARNRHRAVPTGRPVVPSIENPPVRLDPGTDLGAGASLSLRTTAESLPKITGLREPEPQGGTNNFQKTTARLRSSEGERAKDPSHDTAGPFPQPHKVATPAPLPQSHRTAAPILHVGAGTHGNALSVPCTEILPKPMVMPNQTLVLENGTFTLTCNSSPSADTVLWLRDGASLMPSERLVLSPDNRTLTVLGVTRGNAGPYQCEVGNPISTNRSEPNGLDSAQIDPPGSIALTLGSLLTLTCVADSIPASSYRWVLNGTDTKETGSSLTFNSITQDHQGTYTCQTHNPITGRTAWASVAVWVTGTGESPGWSNALQTQGSQCWHQRPSAVLGGSWLQGAGWGDCDAPRPALSAGAVAGIVIGSLAGAALVGVMVYFLWLRGGAGRDQHWGGGRAPQDVRGCRGPLGHLWLNRPRFPQTLQPRQPDVYEELKK
uniref:Ig-like domain-containing protein n=1 Tax=Terrapene triunguis TaxID=2587831 RepID=A0A674K019_9SAUR